MKSSAVLLVVLMAILVLAIGIAYWEWTSVDTVMPTVGYLALFGGIFFSIVVGCGLMGLMFYSSRRGYDERANTEWLPHDDGDDRDA